MEITPLATYLAANPDNKKLHKRVTRAIKRYRHAVGDMAHAEKDLSHAKNDCDHAVKTLKAALNEYKTGFENWLHEDEEGIEIIDESTTGEDSAIAETAKDDDEDLFDDGNEAEEILSIAVDDLDHAARDFKHAIKDARHASADLDEVEFLLLEVLDFAEDDGVALNLVEAKSYVATQATSETPTAPAEN
jgi:hypothetical protein